MAYAPNYQCFHRENWSFAVLSQSWSKELQRRVLELVECQFSSKHPQTLRLDYSDLTHGGILYFYFRKRRSHWPILFYGQRSNPTLSTLAGAIVMETKFSSTESFSLAWNFSPGPHAVFSSLFGLPKFEIGRSPFTPLARDENTPTAKGRRCC